MQKGLHLDFYDAHVLQKWFWYIVPTVESGALLLEVDFVSEVNTIFVRLSDGHALYYAAGSGRDFQEAMEKLKIHFLEHYPLHFKK